MQGEQFGINSFYDWFSLRSVVRSGLKQGKSLMSMGQLDFAVVGTNETNDKLQVYSSGLKHHKSHCRKQYFKDQTKRKFMPCRSLSHYLCIISKFSYSSTHKFVNNIGSWFHALFSAATKMTTLIFLCNNISI